MSAAIHDSSSAWGVLRSSPVHDIVVQLESVVEGSSGYVIGSIGKTRQSGSELTEPVKAARVLACRGELRIHSGETSSGIQDLLEAYTILSGHRTEQAEIAVVIGRAYTANPELEITTLRSIYDIGMRSGERWEWGTVLDQALAFGLEFFRKEQESFCRKNQQLEAEIEKKQKELMTATMQLSQRNDFLQRLQERLDRLVVTDDLAISVNIRQELLSIVDDIRVVCGCEQAWHAFEVQFQQVHGDLLHILAERYPMLSEAERKVCSLIRINLSTKEIGTVMNVSPRTVETYRFRIRNKLGLARNNNLGTFLASLA
jgi:DNA-binding CsgD family transcriptional regulator